MATTNKTPVLYFGVKLSDNVVETPEGYLVFKGAVIARTGFQTYKFKELPQDEAAEQGIVAAPDDDVVVYRSAEEVFSKACIASFEGKSVTDRHPGELLNVEIDVDYSRGHVQNIRKAEEILEDGNEGLVGDIIVKCPHLIAKWKAGIRELSCGYGYHLLKVGDKIYQVDIRGNHVAFVESGRAGSNVRVNDSKPTEGINEMEQNEIAFGEGIKAVAEKTDGKGVAAFFKGLFSLTGNKPAAVAMDSAHGKDCSCGDCKGAADAKAADRARLHAALDRELDAKDNAAEEQAAADAADAEALKTIFTSPSSEATRESGADADREEIEEGAEDAEREEEEEEGEGEDEAVESNASPEIPAGARPQPDTPSATDSAYRAGAAAMAKALKPHIARSGDKRLLGAFDTAQRLASKSTMVAKGSYGRFARAAGTANDEAQRSMTSEAQRAKLAEDSYATARKESRNKTR